MAQAKKSQYRIKCEKHPSGGPIRALKADLHERIKFESVSPCYARSGLDSAAHDYVIGPNCSFRRSFQAFGRWLANPGPVLSEPPQGLAVVTQETLTSAERHFGG